MDESQDHTQDEESVVDSPAPEKDGAGFDKVSSELESLMARLDREIEQELPGEDALEEIDASDFMSGAELLSLPTDFDPPPPTDFDPLPPTDFDPLLLTDFDPLLPTDFDPLPEIGETIAAATNIQTTSFPTPSPGESSADAGAEFSQRGQLQTDSTTSLSETPFESGAPPTFAETPMFLEPDNENEVMSTGESVVALESLDETGDVLGLLITNIDNELAANETAAEKQTVSHFLTSSANDATDKDEEQHVLFTLDGAAYSFPIASVTEIGRPLLITPIPNVPEWLAGVANLRGDIISVVDLRRFFGLGDDEAPHGGRMLVLRSKREEMHAALMVDAVRGIRIFNGRRVQQVTADVETSVAAYTRGVYEHDQGLVVLLDPEKLMLSPEMQQFEVTTTGLSHRSEASAQPFDAYASLTTTLER